MSVSGSNPVGFGTPHKQPPEVLVKRLFARISEVSSLPAVAVQIIEVANDPNTGAADLLEAVEIDAALAMRIMRTVNSSYYSLQNRVADLKLAITLLGFKEIRNLAMTAYIAQLFEKGSGHGGYTREGLWNHLVGVGTVAKLIAETCRKVAPREAYLAGLLHDLGWILVDQYLNKPFCEVVDRLDPEGSVCDLENEILGFDHAELGEFVALQWHLPEHLTAAIRHHHVPEEYEGPHRDMVYVVALANFFCHAKGLSALGVSSTQMPPSRLFTRLGMQKSHVAQIWEQLDEVLTSVDVMVLAQSA
jgi:HD-like signal output (HDOD) protein